MPALRVHDGDLTSKVTLTIPTEDVRALDELAFEFGLSRSALVREILEHGIGPAIARASSDIRISAKRVRDIVTLHQAGVVDHECTAQAGE